MTVISRYLFTGPAAPSDRCCQLRIAVGNFCGGNHPAGLGAVSFGLGLFGLLSKV